MLGINSASREMANEKAATLGELWSREEGEAAARPLPRVTRWLESFRSELEESYFRMDATEWDTWGTASVVPCLDHNLDKALASLVSFLLISNDPARHRLSISPFSIRDDFFPPLQPIDALKAAIESRAPRMEAILGHLPAFDSPEAEPTATTAIASVVEAYHAATWELDAVEKDAAQSHTAQTQARVTHHVGRTHLEFEADLTITTAALPAGLGLLRLKATPGEILADAGASLTVSGPLPTDLGLSGLRLTPGEIFADVGASLTVSGPLQGVLANPGQQPMETARNGNQPLTHHA